MQVDWGACLHAVAIVPADQIGAASSNAAPAALPLSRVPGFRALREGGAPRDAGDEGGAEL